MDYDAYAQHKHIRIMKWPEAKSQKVSTDDIFVNDFDGEFHFWECH